MIYLSRKRQQSDAAERGCRGTHAGGSTASQETAPGVSTFLLQLFVPLVFLDDLHGSLGVVEREQDLV